MKIIQRIPVEIIRFEHSNNKELPAGLTYLRYDATHWSTYSSKGVELQILNKPLVAELEAAYQEYWRE